ncbi:hypothetical protein JL722_3056 [Aureococcus anophagefferens]|nr:hypothetical protein JL722_3056 [Aureococcus anophagefferens]
MAQNVYLDDWAILGVPPGSDQDAIRKAYRKQALLHHPDKGGDPAKFRQVAEAYVALSEASGAATPRSTRTDYATADPTRSSRASSAPRPPGPPRRRGTAATAGREHNGVSFATVDEINNDEDAALFGAIDTGMAVSAKRRRARSPRRSKPRQGKMP